MGDEIALREVFERLGGIEQGQRSTHERINVLVGEVKCVKESLVGTNGEKGLRVRVASLEEWKTYMVPKCKEHMTRSARRTWAVVLSVLGGIGVWLYRSLTGG